MIWLVVTILVLLHVIDLLHLSEPHGRIIRLTLICVAVALLIVYALPLHGVTR